MPTPQVWRNSPGIRDTRRTLPCEPAMPTPQVWRNSPAIRDTRRKWPREPTGTDSRLRELQRATSELIADLPARNAHVGIPRSRRSLRGSKKSIELRSNMPVLCARICHTVWLAHSRLRVARAPHVGRTGPSVANSNASTKFRSNPLPTAEAHGSSGSAAAHRAATARALAAKQVRTVTGLRARQHRGCTP